MAWIRTVSEEDAEEPLAGLLARSRDKHTGQVDNVLAVHGLHPAGLEAHLGLYRAVMRPTPGLSAAERELIAFTVSRLDGCHY